MACVAFDLDNTLGFFGVTNKLAFLWSKEFITNPEQSNKNAPVTISKGLEKKLARARENFARYLLKDKALLFQVLRPNLDALILPLLEAKRGRKLKTVIVYSNTGVGYSIELAKFLIETHYKAAGLFSLTADHWHPLRTEDRKDARPGEYVEPYKTIGTLQRLFKKATRGRAPVPLKNILFVDDRQPKHVLQEQEKDGLTYLVPSRFVPSMTPQQRQYILFLAVHAMEQQGLLTSKEYLESGFCNRTIPYEFTKAHTIHGFSELLNYVRNAIHNEERPSTPWKADTAAIMPVIRSFLNEV